MSSFMNCAEFNNTEDIAVFDVSAITNVVNVEKNTFLNDGEENEHQKMEKLKESFLLLKKKMCRSHDLIQQYNDKLKECERLRTELDKTKDEATKTKRNYNSSLAKVIKLELQNAEFKKNIEILTNSISSYETRVAGDQQYSQQLVCKMTDMEEKHSEKLMEIDLEKSALQVKVKGLEQEIKAIKKSHESELKKMEKKITLGEETKKKTKTQSPLPPPAPSPVLPLPAVVKSTRDIAVNTTAVEIIERVNKRDKWIQTNELNGSKNNPYALFCDNCDKMFDSPPYHKISNVMTKYPSLITRIGSPSQLPETKKEDDQCTLTPVAVKCNITSPGTSQSQHSPKSEKQKDSTSVIEMLQKKLEIIERKMKRNAKKSARASTDYCNHLHHPTYYPPNSFPGFPQQDVFSQFWKRVLEFGEQQASESQTQVRGQKRKQGKQQGATKAIPKKRRKAIKTSRKWIVESLTQKNEDEKSDTNMTSTSNERSCTNNSQTICTPSLPDDAFSKTDKNIEDDSVMVEEEQPNIQDSLETEPIVCQNDVSKVQTDLYVSNLIMGNSVSTVDNKKTLRHLSSNVITGTCSKRQKLSLPESQEVDNESVASFPSRTTEVICKMLEEKQTANDNDMLEFILKNEDSIDTNNADEVLADQTNLQELIQDNSTCESVQKFLNIEDHSVDENSKMPENNPEINECSTGRSTPCMPDEVTVDPSDNSIKNTVSSCQPQCQDDSILLFEGIQSKTILTDTQVTNTSDTNVPKSLSNMTVKSFASITRLSPVTTPDIYSDATIPQKMDSNIAKPMRDIGSNISNTILSHTLTKPCEAPDAPCDLESKQNKNELTEDPEKLTVSGTRSNTNGNCSAETNLQKCDVFEIHDGRTSAVMDVTHISDINDTDSSITESDISSANEFPTDSIDQSITDKSLKNIESNEKRDDHLINNHREVNGRQSAPTPVASGKRKRFISPRKASLRNVALFGDESFDDEPSPASKLQATSRLRGNQEIDKEPKKIPDLKVTEDEDTIVKEFEKPIATTATNSGVVNNKNKKLGFDTETLETIACLNCIAGMHKDSPVAMLSKHLQVQLEQTQKVLSQKKRRTTKREAYETLVTAQLNAFVTNDDSMNITTREVVEKLSQPYRSRSVAKCVINFLCEAAQDAEPLDRTYTPPAPMMTKVQQKLVMLLVSLKRIDPSIFTMIQIGIEYKIFRLGHAPEVDVMETLVRVYTVLARIAKDREKVRILCCDALYCLRLKAIPIIYVALTCWPEVFPMCDEHQDVLPKCIAHLVLSQQATGKFPRLMSTKHLLTTYYKCPKAGYLSTDLATQFLTTLQEKRHSGLNTAIILLSKREGTTWAYKHIIRGGLLQMIVNNNHPSSYEAFYLLGKIMRSFPIKDDSTVGDIVEQLCDLINSGRVTHEQEEGIVSALLSLARHKFTEVATSVLRWKPNKSLRPITVEQLQIFYSIHPVQWWTKFIKGHSAAIGKMVQ